MLLSDAFKSVKLSIGYPFAWLISCAIDGPVALSEFLAANGWRRVSRWRWER